MKNKTISVLGAALFTAACATPQFGGEQQPNPLDEAFIIGDAGQSITASPTNDAEGRAAVQLTITDAEQKGDLALTKNAEVYTCGDETGPIDAVDSLAEKFIAYASETSVDQRLAELNNLLETVETQWQPDICHHAP